MTFPFTTQRRVEFRDTDAAGIMHFSTYFNFMEVAEHEALRALGLSVYMEHEGQTISWPRVSVNCDYQRALKFEDEVTLGVGIDNLGEKSITWRFGFQCQDKAVATGKMVVVCCEIDHGRPPRSIPIPPEIRQQLETLVIPAS